MLRVLAKFAMSLDGFIADPKDDVSRLYKWFSNGDTPIQGAMGRVFMTSAVSAKNYTEFLESAGSFVTGRHDFDASDAWGGTAPMNVPTFIVTHNPPQEWLSADSPFTFITNGVDTAIEGAKQAANGKNVLVSGSKIVQQCLNLGLLDEIHIDLVPILLSDGIRLFDKLSPKPFDLEILEILEASGVTHLKYRVLKD
jgi:dihydrofolate reductase